MDVCQVHEEDLCVGVVLGTLHTPTAGAVAYRCSVRPSRGNKGMHCQKYILSALPPLNRNRKFLFINKESQKHVRDCKGNFYVIEFLLP